MIVTAHQPVYIPWLGFFHKILLADKFVCLDNVEIGGTHHKDNFVARNRIKSPKGSLWLTVPLHSSPDTLINKVEIDNSTDWQKKHWLAIEYNYKKSPYLSVYAQQLKSFCQQPWKKIGDLNIALLQDFFWPALQIKTKFILASTLNLKQKRAALVLELCQKTQAATYISGALGKDYLDESEFTRQGIKVLFQDYRHPTYTQCWGKFIPYLSTLDLLFNEGPRSQKIILSGNITKL